MKKTLLLLTVCLIYICARAQTIDKKLLIGKWEVYSMRGAGHFMCRDTMDQEIEGLIRLKKSIDPSEQMTPDDSLALVKKIRAEMDEIFKTNMTFEENGHTAMRMASIGEYDKPSEETGTYEWTGDNKITQKLGEADPIVYTIKVLNISKLVLRSEIKDLELVFTRAK
jgi:hypothetical protein